MPAEEKATNAQQDNRCDADAHSYACAVPGAAVLLAVNSIWIHLGRAAAIGHIRTPPAVAPSLAFKAAACGRTIEAAASAVGGSRPGPARAAIARIGVVDCHAVRSYGAFIEAVLHIVRQNAGVVRDLA